ncbi:RNA polymerase sigma factor [Sphingomicrobium sediminis]|uniref:RNA polymerase subunit sigma-24 n=1 Tax=Sphingomicrobium sediminis TaxID=2950949 RepID=A0A9X2EHM8_9SPHN|nr:DUF6596 domain-containing protein [Sphingomicrobium sediminis]MCM8557722.1 RNA polymerase subunit sigma-24 [Sphingomicrobium sediminis]
MADGRILSLADDIMAARPRVVAALAAQFRDLDAAEDGFDAAVEKLLASGERPQDVSAFLFVAGKRKILDARRKSGREARALEEAAKVADTADIIDFPEAVPDERLKLLFICCHPAIAIEARVALTLRVVMGVEVEAIASGLLAKVDAVRQRITRAKAKINEAGVPFELPHRRFWPERVEGILMTLELAFAAAYREGARAELAEEVERLALLLVEVLPEEGEALGLAAMVLLARSREVARGEGADMVALSEQDTDLWDAVRIEAAAGLLKRPFAHPAGRFRYLALIHLAHAQRKYRGSIDWEAIVTFYDALARLDPGPVVAINRAVALGCAGKVEAGLAAMPEPMPDFGPWHAAQADLLEKHGDVEGARTAVTRALELTQAAGPRAMLQRRLARL